MGRTYLFECPKCSYKGNASGGSDQGLDVVVQTIVCKDCKKLYDAVIRLKVAASASASSLADKAIRNRKRTTAITPPHFEKVLATLPFPGSTRFKWLEYSPGCPVSAAHKVQLWKDPGKCPRCGVFLEKSPLPFRLWE